MVADLLRWGNRGFPNRAFSIPATGAKGRRGRIASAAAGAASIAVVGYLGVGYVQYQHIAAAEHQAALRAEAANADLQQQLAQLRDQAGGTERQLHTTQGKLTTLLDETRNKQQQLAVSEQASVSKGDRIAQLNRALEQAQRDLHMSEVQRVTLAARISKAETELVEQHGRQTEAQTTLDQSQKKLQQLTADRDKAVGEREHLRSRVTELEHRLSAAMAQPAPKPTAEARPQAAAAPAVAAVAAPPDTVVSPRATAANAAPVRTPSETQVAVAAPPAPAVQPAPAPVQTAAAAAPVPAPQAQPQPAATVASLHAGRGGLAEFERVLGSAGVDVAHLFARYGMRTGDGGPFVPASLGRASGANALTAEKLAALRMLLKSVPVSAPLDSYEIGSRFGVRGDPINGHSAYHTGLDFRAPYESPVYATAAGVVTYAGYRDDYGKVVEIDHGNGLTTRYAHLHRQTVSVGQQVAARTQIGLLGSTGRATGPHVHYEILVNGEPQDPERFMGLARAIPVAQR